MLSKTRSVLAFAATIAASSLAPSMAFAQFPPPPPMAPAGPPPIAAAAPPAFAGPGPAALGGPRLGPAAGPRADLAARGAGGGPTLVNAARTTAVNIGGAGYRYGGVHGYGYGARAASYAGAYAAGAYAGYSYGGARSSGYSSSDCYYVYRRHSRYLVCD
ncbi:hypothetical protein AOQ71_22365 [Bradyrhizobium manausense]|uniref:Uncharacterized protein n=2 Tax=Bradyrhizobium manausense TaxID=989370 RepID=A0A0R3DIX8_9BRAD|nr:hypothetical protein AOQ71_22365 [Bradyrhizobium manausense]